MFSSKLGGVEVSLLGVLQMYAGGPENGLNRWELETEHLLSQVETSSDFFLLFWRKSEYFLQVMYFLRLPLSWKYRLVGMMRLFDSRGVFYIKFSQLPKIKGREGVKKENLPSFLVFWTCNFSMKNLNVCISVVRLIFRWGFSLLAYDWDTYRENRCNLFSPDTYINRNRTLRKYCISQITCWYGLLHFITVERIFVRHTHKKTN